MKNQSAVWILFLVALVCSITSSYSQTYNFQWANASWTTPSYGATVTNSAGSGVTVTVAITNSTGNNSDATTGNDDNRFQNNTPKVGATTTNWLLPGTTGTNPLAMTLDWTTLTANVTTVISFSQPVTAVQFYVGDIDRSTTVSYIDQVTVTGLYNATAVPNPTVTKYIPASDTVLVSGNVAYGNSALAGGNSATTSLETNGATVQYTFSQAITSMTILYNQGPGATGNPANQTIVIGDISFTKTIAPVTTNISSPAQFNTGGTKDITDPVGTDADGTVVGYTVETLPTAAMGTLTYFNGTSYVAVVAGALLTVTQANSIRFNPNTTFTGDATFTYTATDNTGVKSNTSTYTIPVDPTPIPTTNNIVAPVENNSYGQTTIPALEGAIPSGSIASFTINTIPNAGTQGTLYLCNPSCVAVSASQSIAYADRDKLKFDPLPSFTGNAGFTYTAVSALGINGNTASYTIPVTNEPPVANTIMSNVLLNTDPAKPIPALIGSDADGTVANFRIITIPPAGEGVLYLCTPTCATVSPNQLISVANAVNLQFDPTAGFTGTSRFTYTAIDNNGNISPAASYNIPVKGTTTINIAPYSDNVVAQSMPNSYGPTLIPTLSGHDPENGTPTTYTIETIPVGTQGTLSYCSNGSEPCTGVVTPITAGTTLTPAQANSLKFDPAAGFTGTASFTYSSTDALGLKGNIANYSIPVINVPPVANNINAPAMPNTYGQTAIPALSGHDPSTIASYNITAIPNVLSGGLYMCNPTCALLLGPTTVAVADIGKLRFDPSGSFTGTATLTYTATDNNGAVSQPATYNIPVINTALDPNLPPTADNKTATAMPNTNAATAIGALSGTDPDGTVTSYVITSLPPATQGVLFLCNPTCVAVTTGQTIVAADAGNLRFDPTASYEGNSIFTYNSVDNAGKSSNVATYTIPVTGTPPRAANVTSASMAKADGLTPIPSLSGTDPDGSIVSYTVLNLPPTASGVLQLCNPTCTNVTAGQVILTADAASLRFDPAAGYTGLFADFNYTATDNSGRLSNTAAYSLRLTNGESLLPVTLVSFTGEKKATTAELIWKTELETNLQAYIVERSADGVNFNAVGTVAPIGAGVTNTYHFSDDIQNITVKQLYYRLKIVDLDGKTRYSVVVTIRLTNITRKEMTVSPNPAVENIRIKIVSDIPTSTTIRIVNTYGETIYRNKLLLVKGDNFIFVNNLSSKPGGMYTVQALVGEQLLVQKLVISQ